MRILVYVASRLARRFPILTIALVLMRFLARRRRRDDKVRITLSDGAHVQVSAGRAGR